MPSALLNAQSSTFTQKLVDEYRDLIQEVKRQEESEPYKAEAIFREFLPPPTRRGPIFARWSLPQSYSKKTSYFSWSWSRPIVARIFRFSKLPAIRRNTGHAATWTEVNVKAKGGMSKRIKPECFLDYNLNKIAMDFNNQYVAYYSFKRKSMK
ncbi:hypothetical protein EVAR_50922_1 [Eumeta japonica]|uniref:Uncharacterized protein n=1 Tax=Eumeta variegata TaxID=151549 RepID=A0A4C1Y1J5_EUMVA|nr:hypothetical protein EVAR_50922_1 [Eumeta japonica]